MAYIEFEDVKKIYGTGEAQVRALDGVSFQVEKGEFVVLLGSSGAGKTTLLNMLGGMDTITEGKILFDGRDISHMSGFEMARYRRHDVGFVFQFYNLIPNLTALENVDAVKPSFSYKFAAKIADFKALATTVGAKNNP